MAKRVICECPNCGVETIVDKAELARDPLFECPECEATMEVDLAPPPPPDIDVGPETLASPESTGEPTPIEQEPPRERELPPRERKLIAKTQPMVQFSGHVAAPSPQPRPRRSTAGEGPLTLVLVGVLGLGGGWLARGVAAHDKLRQTVESYCDEDLSARTARDMCEQVLAAP